jgi:hypothetical protein
MRALSLHVWLALALVLVVAVPAITERTSSAA